MVSAEPSLFYLKVSYFIWWSTPNPHFKFWFIVQNMIILYNIWYKLNCRSVHPGILIRSWTVNTVMETWETDVPIDQIATARPHDDMVKRINNLTFSSLYHQIRFKVMQAYTIMENGFRDHFLYNNRLWQCQKVACLTDSISLSLMTGYCLTHWLLRSGVDVKRKRNATGMWLNVVFSIILEFWY